MTLSSPGWRPNSLPPQRNEYPPPPHHHSRCSVVVVDLDLAPAPPPPPENTAWFAAAAAVAIGVRFVGLGTDVSGPSSPAPARPICGPTLATMMTRKYY